MEIILQYLIGLPIVVLGAIAVWQSSVIIEEKKERQRKGLTDYYDNPIGKNNE